MKDGNKISSKFINQARQLLKLKIGKNNREIQEQHLRTVWQIEKSYRRVKLRRKKIIFYYYLACRNKKFNLYELNFNLKY